MSNLKTFTFEGVSYLAFRWEGDLPLPEEFSMFGYLKDDNGRDLESVDYEFELEKGREPYRLSTGDWIVKRVLDNRFCHVSNEFAAEYI